MEKYVEGGWVTATKYEDELRDMLKERTGGNKEKARRATACLHCSVRHEVCADSWLQSATAAGPCT